MDNTEGSEALKCASFSGCLVWNIDTPRFFGDDLSPYPRLFKQ